MRELKFRAIIPNAEMAKEPLCEIKPFITVYFTLKDLFCSYIPNYEKRMLTQWMYYGKNVPDQYVGLKDRNSVEIFEGDVVTFKNDVYTQNPLPIIKYRKSSGKIVWNDKACSYQAVCSDGKPYVWCNELTESIEVIGNIYENPELLVKGECYGN